MTLRLIIAPNESEASKLAASRVIEAVEANPNLVLGLAAGRTFDPVYAALAKAAPDLSAVTMVQLDEYEGTGRDNPLSFRAFLSTRLIAPLRAPPRRRLWIDGAAPDPDAEIGRHARSLADAGGLDLQLLGLGTNGHVAFNEPGSSRIAQARVVALSVATRTAAAAAGLKPVPLRGLTLGMDEILAARSLLLVVLGARKAGILARSLQHPADPSVPASFLGSHGDLTVIADAAAASELEKRTEGLHV